MHDSTSLVPPDSRSGVGGHVGSCLRASAGADQGDAVTLLQVCVSDSEYGPVLGLSGEADLTTLGQLTSALEAQIWAGTRLLTVDLSRLRYADSASIAAFVQAARSLRDQGGELELLRPQRAIARILALTGVDKILTVRTEIEPSSQETPERRLD